MHPETQMVLPLPYEAIGETMTRNGVRDVLKDIGGKQGRQTYWVPLAQLTFREGFNFRIQPANISMEQWLYDPEHLDITGLAAGLLASSGPPPLEVDATAEGFFVITDGFRRYHAVKKLLDEGVTEYADGSPVHLVEVMINPKETTELDRIVSVFTTQDNKKLTATEIAHGLLRIKEHYGYSNERIGQLIGKSRQYVDQKIGLATEPIVIQQAVKDGTLTPTAATALRNSVTSETDRVHAVEESINKGTPLTVAGASKQERREKAENAQQLTLDMHKDVSKEKEEAEFSCCSVIGSADKIRKHLKGMNKQNQEDVERLLDFIIKDVIVAREFIKRSPDKH